jgi:hypothetical protein
MTTSSASARPYSVFISAPAFGTYLNPEEITVRTFVNGGLSQQDTDELVQPDAVRAFALINRLFEASIIIFALWLGLLIYGVAGLMTGFAPPILGVLAVVAALALTAFVLRAQARAQHAGDKLRALQADLIAAGRLEEADALSNTMYGDLQRIDRSLRSLQETRGTDFDADARAAVVAVLCRNVHEPSKRQREIADSSATDENSNNVRAVITARHTQWRSDVALAEGLILGLEAAAATGKPSDPQLAQA